MSGDLIERIYGRDDLALFFSRGRILLASSVSEVYSRVLYELLSTRLKETKIIQHSLKKVEIQLVLDKKQPDDVSTGDIISLIKNGFQQKVGSDVEIVVKEVKKIDKHGPRIVSKVDRSDFKVNQYI